MRCEVFTLFPDLIRSVGSHSMVKRAQEKSLLSIGIHNLRDFTHDDHRTADDTPYGGGGGMVMKAEPILQAITHFAPDMDQVRLIMPSPQGKRFTHQMALEFSQESRPLVFICGHYEGIDERVNALLPIEEISIGDYVLTGGELPALVMIEASMRLIPGALGDPDSAQQDSFVESLLDFPHYTRPATIQGREVPGVLLSGNHEAIRRWRRKESLRQTFLKRPDLFEHHTLTKEDSELLKEIEQEYASAVPPSPSA